MVRGNTENNHDHRLSRWFIGFLCSVFSDQQKTPLRKQGLALTIKEVIV